MLVYNMLYYVFSWGGDHEITPLLNGGDREILYPLDRGDR